ncbi:MAG TPA: hypothetical protein VK988_11110 [Acidimicrobiales bacterium]|nr:hypothetical protein [Acidimicrobiales bacterium]
MEFPLTAGAAAAFLEQCRASHSSSITLVSGELGARIRGVSGYFFGFAGADTWVVPADGGGTPQLFVPQAWSTVVVAR